MYYIITTNDIYAFELEKYAENNGFHEGWDAMILELQNE